ncbi:MAG: histidine phosphatase family protein [Clostridiales bacterium]|nr:histidine phosphatase family protein [Clostridiales bacterium]
MRDWTENKVTLILIRHGATKANEEHRYLGKTNEPLAEKGREILKSYKAKKLYPDVDYLFSSPMRRCIDTAKIIYPSLTPIVIPEWEEIDFGRFEYKNYEELKNDAQYQKWIDSQGVLDFPEGERRADFMQRCKSGFIKMCNELNKAAVKDGKKDIMAGMVVHGGTIMSIMSLYAGGNYFDYQVLNGRGYVCSMENINGGEMLDVENLSLKVQMEI